jgi:acyl-CoA carboxylase epsilon subunit-like protein
MRRHDDGMTGAVEGLEVVRGGAAPEELAAVLTVLAARAEMAAAEGRARSAGYDAWRATRLAALSCARRRPGAGSVRRRG